ncbi:DoxX family membrane protein [Pendulispora albinea]|uniref:DoxX family membrane protein n=1 Tax=Pendulispora albinea TaxID=2741071 RepID=A0ABZ2M665_9BACT
MKPIQRWLPTALRILLGLVFFVFGLNGFLQFIPPPPIPDSGQAFLGALVTTGYMIPLIKGTEVICSLLLLSNRFVPLALVILAPINVNIFLFHSVLAPAGLPIGILLVALEISLAWAHRAAFRPLFAARAAAAEPEWSEQAVRSAT